jgi:mono/diheme cytochrome c family protein
MKTITSKALLLVCSISTGAAAIGADDALLERGTYLMESIVACANCHTPKDPATGEEIEGMAYAGSFVITEPGFTAYAPNITMDVETGIGSWTDEEIIVAIRDGLRPDGTLIGPPMPSPFYRTMSDYDVLAIVAYMRTIKPVENVAPKSKYDIPLPPNYGPMVGSVPDVSRDDPVAYGKYVTNSLGHCTGCHTPLEKGQIDFSRTNIGGRLFENIAGLGFNTVSSNITPHPVAGIGEWSDEEVKRAITKGISRNGRELSKAMAFSYYNNISDEDLDAIVAFLRSLPALSAADTE